MSQRLREKYEEVDLTPGAGKRSAVISLFFGSMAFLGALCFLMPGLLTMPELREAYDPGVMRYLLQAGIAVSFGFGLLAMARHESPVYGLTGMGLALGAALLASGRVEAPAVDSRGLYLGLDYFILTLVGLAIVFIPLERAFPKDPQQNILRKGWITDLKYFMLSHMGVQLISFLTVIPIQVFLAEATAWPLRSWVAAQPVWLQFIEILMVVDLGTYWIHRAMHEVPALWKFHAIHHSTEEMNWLASSRLHVVEILVNRFAGYLPIFLLGFSPKALYAYLIFISFHAIFLHANARMRFPLLRWVLATPEYHHWHHSSEEAAIDRNYAGFLPLYDVLFGTAYLPGHLASRYGTVSDEIPEGFLGQLAYPFRGWLRRR